MTAPSREPSAVLLDRIETLLRAMGNDPTTPEEYDAAQANLVVLRDRLAAAEAVAASIERALDKAMVSVPSMPVTEDRLVAVLPSEAWTEIVFAHAGFRAASGEGEIA